MTGDVNFEVSFIQFHQGNILPQTRILPIPPHQSHSPLHPFQLLTASFQPPLRSEEHAIFTVHFLIALNRPVILTNVGSAGDEDAVDGIAFARYDFTS